MPVEAVPINFLLENDRYLTPTGVANEINKVLETGTYIGHLVVTKPTHSAWDGRQVGDAMQGIVLLVDKPGEQSAQ